MQPIRARTHGWHRQFIPLGTHWPGTQALHPRRRPGFLPPPIPPISTSPSLPSRVQHSGQVSHHSRPPTHTFARSILLRKPGRYPNHSCQCKISFFSATFITFLAKLFRAHSRRFLCAVFLFICDKDAAGRKQTRHSPFLEVRCPHCPPFIVSPPPNPRRHFTALT